MYNSSGGGYDQGGGYLNSPNVGGTSQQQQPKQPNRQKAQNIMPVTVGQITKAEQIEDKFLVGNIELNQIVLVGLVRSSQETSTRLDYLIDDMTDAPIEVRQFVDNDENTPDDERTQMIRENIYVRVFGHIRAFAGKRSVVAFRIAPLLDMNELTTHILEVIYAHAYIVTGGKPLETPNAAPQQQVQPKQATEQPTQPVNSANAATNGNDSDIDDISSGLSLVQRQVLKMFGSTMDEKGMSVTQVCNSLKHLSESTIREAIEFLSNEGHIYTTTDEEHYKPTDS